MTGKLESLLGIPQDLLEEIAIVPCGGCALGQVEIASLQQLEPVGVSISLPSIVCGASVSVRRLEVAHAVVALSGCSHHCSSALLSDIRTPDISVDTSTFSLSEEWVTKIQESLIELRQQQRKPDESTEELHDEFIEDIQELDCIGLKCPMPIVKLSTAAKTLGQDRLDVCADDPAFPADVEAWANQAGAQLHWISKGTEGLYRVHVTLPVSATKQREVKSQTNDPSLQNLPILTHVDCMKVRSPLQLVQLHKQLKLFSQPGRLVIETLDHQFETDVKLWCEQTNSVLLSLERKGKTIQAVVAIHTDRSVSNNLTEAPKQELKPAKPSRGLSNLQAQSAVSNCVELEFCGMRCPMPILKLNGELRNRTEGMFKVMADDPAFEADVRAWCEQHDVNILNLKSSGKVITATLSLHPIEAPQHTEEHSPSVSKTTQSHYVANDFLSTAVSQELLASTSINSLALVSEPELQGYQGISISTLDAPVSLDFRGLKCPMPIVQLNKQVRGSSGSVFRVVADDPAFPADLKAWCEVHGFKVETEENQKGEYQASIRS